MKNYKFYMFITTILMILSTLLSCGDSDDNITINDKNIIGTWICYEQEIYDAGEQWTEYYDNDKNTLVFNEDYTGNLTCDDRTSIFEISNGANFIWQLSDNKIITTAYNDVYTILSLSKTEMVLRWQDYEDFYIVCKFKKKVEIIDNSERTLTSENLVGRWACISFNDKEGIHNKTLTEDDLKTGNFYRYIDFYSKGAGYISTFNDMILGSSSTSFTWNYTNNKINIDIHGSEETWKVDSFKGGVLTLSRDKYKASFKKSAVKID